MPKDNKLIEETYIIKKEKISVKYLELKNFIISINSVVHLNIRKRIALAKSVKGFTEYILF